MKKIFSVIILVFVLCLSGCGAKEATNTEDAQRKDATRLIVYAPMSTSSTVIDGWIAEIILDELGMKIEVVCGELEGKKVEDADVIIVPYGELSVSEFVDTGVAIQWTEEMLSEYGENIITYRKEQLDSFSQLCDGKIYGFMRSEQGKGVATCMITKYSDKPEEAMKFLNWLCDPETMVSICNGPKGICWNVDEEGYYYLTELGQKCMKDFTTEMPGQGGLTFGDGSLAIYPSIYHQDDINPLSKYEEKFDGADWIKTKE